MYQCSNTVPHGTFQVSNLSMAQARFKVETAKRPRLDHCCDWISAQRLRSHRLNNDMLLSITVALVAAIRCITAQVTVSAADGTVFQCPASRPNELAYKDARTFFRESGSLLPESTSRIAEWSSATVFVCCIPIQS